MGHQGLYMTSCGYKYKKALVLLICSHVKCTDGVLALLCAAYLQRVPRPALQSSSSRTASHAYWHASAAGHTHTEVRGTCVKGMFTGCTGYMVIHITGSVSPLGGHIHIHIHIHNTPSWKQQQFTAKCSLPTTFPFPALGIWKVCHHQFIYLFLQFFF